MHFCVSSFSAAATVIVLVLHVSCFTGNITVSSHVIVTDPSTTIQSDEIFTTVPSATDRIVVNEGLSRDDAPSDVNGPRPEQPNDDETPVIEKLDEGDVVLSVDGVRVTDKPQPEVLYEVNESSSIKAPSNSEESHGAANENSDSRWVQRIQKVQRVQTTRSRSLEIPTKNATVENHTGRPVTLGQIIANVLYGAPWPTSEANIKCANDMRLYNLHMQNFTLWAAKSK